MLRRWAALGLLASLVALTGCRTAVSDASTTSTTSSTVTTTSTTAPTTTSVFALPPLPPPPPPATTTTAAPTLAAALGSVWAHTASSSCLTVYDANGATLFERNTDLPVVPASTMKLLTATTALARLDPSSRLTTRVLASAPPGPDGTVQGDVWLVGGGDPLLGTLPFGAHFKIQPHLTTAIEVLADNLRNAGVHHITGRVLGDDSRYDKQRYVPSWPSAYASEHEAGPLSALLVDDGDAAWSPREVPFGDPAAGGAGVFTQVLRGRGVAVDGDAAAGGAPAGAVELATLPSPTIAEIVREMLLDSNNNTAELLLKELGLRVLGQPTTDAGRRVVIDTLTSMGMPMAGVTVNDGSGLDRGDRVTCRLLSALLTQSPVHPVIDGDLPVAGRTGTLYNRFLGTPVVGHLRAKTGTIIGVASLAGFADGPGARQVTFVYVQNRIPSEAAGHRMQEELGRVLVTVP